MTNLSQERLVDEILRASFEAVSLEDFGQEILPLLDDLFDTSVSLLYQCKRRRELTGIAGALELHSKYSEEYYSSDPMQKAIPRENQKILFANRCPEWKMFLKCPAYNEHATRYGLDNYLHIRLTEIRPHEPGNAGFLLGRSKKQPDFNEQDSLLLARILPALESLVRRSDRAGKERTNHSIVEALADMDQRPMLALDFQGHLLWISERAEAWTGLRLRGRQVVPDLLVEAARRIGALMGKDLSCSPIPTVTIQGKKSEKIRIDLSLARTRNDTPFVLAVLENANLPALTLKNSGRFQLTTAESKVLDLIAQGLSDRAIAQRLFISLATVRTHVGHILDKMGVHSRVQAALLAHGLSESPLGN